MCLKFYFVRKSQNTGGIPVGHQKLILFLRLLEFALFLANTVLKMAKKRAQVDAVLTVASLSEIFTQDMEDF